MNFLEIVGFVFLLVVGVFALLWAAGFLKVGVKVGRE